MIVIQEIHLSILLACAGICLSACQDDPVEKCVLAQVEAAKALEEEAAKGAKRSGNAVDWGKYIRPTLTQVEADARLKCLRAANGKN